MYIDVYVDTDAFNFKTMEETLEIASYLIHNGADLKKKQEFCDAEKKLARDAERQRQSFAEMKNTLDLGVSERSELFKRQLKLLDSMLGRFERSGDVDDYVRKTLAEGNAVYWQNCKGRVAITEGPAEEVKLATPPAKTGKIADPSKTKVSGENLQKIMATKDGK